MKQKKKLIILIIENNRLIRDGISAMINEQSDLKLIAKISEKEDSLPIIYNLKPDLVLIDFNLRNRNSLHVVISIKDNSPDIKIIIMVLLTVHRYFVLNINLKLFFVNNLLQFFRNEKFRQERKPDTDLPVNNLCVIRNRDYYCGVSIL